MKSIKLSNLIRSRLEVALTENITKEYTQKIGALGDKKSKLALKVYKDVLGKEFKAIQEAPEHWFHIASSIRVRFSAEYSYQSLDFGEGVTYKVTYHQSRGCFAVYDEDHKLSVAYQKIKEEHRKLNEARDKTLTETRRVLKSVTTTKRLCEIWPEISSIVESVAEKCVRPTGIIPANQITDLNKALGLK